jgi:hypothetical protein
VTINGVSLYFLPILSLLVSTAILALQIRMFLRYRHTSFLLLTAATVAELLYSVCWYSLSYYVGRGDLLPDSFPASWPYIATALQAAALILGLWGTVLLFNSYIRLSDTAERAAMSNNRRSGRET